MELSIKESFNKLSRFVEYRNGPVAIPHMFNDIKETNGDASLEDFKQELLRMWNDGEVELMILNEVREAVNPEWAISHDGALYYYIVPGRNASVEKDRDWETTLA